MIYLISPSNEESSYSKYCFYFILRTSLFIRLGQLLLLFKEHLLRCSGYDKTSFNVVKTRFGKLFGPFKFIFDSSLEKGIFSVDSKIVGVTPVFKSGDRSDLETSELDQSHCFHPFPEHLSMFCLIVENKYLVENNFFL